MICIKYLHYNVKSIHPRYDERELYEMLRGFQEDFPEGGIFRYQFESFFPDMKMGKTMGDMVFR